MFLIASLVMNGSSTVLAPRYSYIAVLLFAVYVPLTTTLFMYLNLFRNVDRNMLVELLRH